MLCDLSSPRQIKLKNSGGTVIDPATETKQDSIVTLLQAIDSNTDNIEISAEQIDLNTDELEAKMQSVRDQLNVLLSTRASESTLIDVESELTALNAQMNVALSSRASEATLVQVRDYLDTVETKLQSLIDKNQAQETGGNLADIKTNTDNLDVAQSTRASEATSQEILDTIGQESGSTVLTKLQDLYDELNLLFGNGTAKTRIVDGHDKEAQFSAFGLLKTANESMIADYRFNLDSLSDEWTMTTTGTGSYSIPDSITGLQLNTGASASSKSQADSNVVHYYQSGRGQLAKMSVILGDSGVAGNIREWGYGDDDNGAFFRMDGTTLKIVIRSDSSEVTIDSSNWDVPVTPDQYGHLYYIQFEWLGVGNIYFYYDEQIVHTYDFIGTSTNFSLQTPDLPLRYRNENTTNTTDVLMKMGCASVVAEGGLILSGKDPDGIIRQAAMTRAGQISVSTPPPEAPVGTTGVIQTEYDAVATTHDNVYLIPDGETLVINRLSSGAETDSTAGNVVELWYDPNGTGVGMSIIDAIFCSGDGDQHDLSASYIGDGTKSIRMRRRRFSGGSKEIFGRWEGYY